MTKHAILSASGAYRWMACPPSARLEMKFPDSRSEYAAEGTFAHELGELRLQKEIGLIDETFYKRRFKSLSKNQFFSDSMMEYLDIYVNFVLERYAVAKASCADPVIMLEQRLDFSPWVPEGFGTGDVVIVSGNKVSTRVNDRVAALGVTAAVTGFRQGNLIDGLIASLRVMATAAAGG